DPAGRRARGLAFAPAERLGRGAVSEMSLVDNTCLTAYQQGLVRHGFVREQAVRRLTRQICERFNVISGGTSAEARSLSGGNLQKFVMGREILQAPKVLIAANPTWGVDVGAAVTIRQALLDLVTQGGTGVLLISEDLNELFEICDRLAVMYEGRLSPVVSVADADHEEIGRWMAGLFDTGSADNAGPSATDGKRHHAAVTCTAAAAVAPDALSVATDRGGTDTDHRRPAVCGAGAQSVRCSACLLHRSDQRSVWHHDLAAEVRAPVAD